MTLVIKKVWQVSKAARVWYYDGPGAQHSCEKTELAGNLTRKRVI